MPVFRPGNTLISGGGIRRGATQAAPSIGLLSDIFGNGTATPPPGFNWPFSSFPITISANGKSTNFNPQSYAKAALSGTAYFVNGSTGLDTNNGLTPATAVKSIWQATTLGNTAAVPFNVSVAAIAGGYPRENGFANSGTPVPNTVAAAYIATGGTVETWAGSTLTWTLDPNFANVWQATRSIVARVIDVANKDVNGDYVEFVNVATEALCAATPGSWAQVGSTLFVARTAGDTVTNLNTRALLQTVPQWVQNATSKDVYLNGFSVQGGTAGGFACIAAATMNFIAVNCQTSFAGYAAAGSIDGFKLDFMTGLTALVNCVGSCAQSDGIGAHWTPGGTAGLNLLTINCIGRNNGRGNVQSCNGWTTHDGVIAIDANGTYFGNFGANVIPINNCQAWMVGTYAHDSQGDTSHGGTITPTDYNTQFTAQMWMQNCSSANSGIALQASDSSTILLRHFTQTSGQSRIQGASAKIGIY